MRTKLSVFCDKVLEAGWLLALIVTPLFFNVYSSRVFEPDKLSILRSIALVMIVAWGIKTLDGSAWGQRSGQRARPQALVLSTRQGEETPPGLWQRLTATPLVLPTVLLVGAYVLSTILSVAPAISLWGSYMRLQGTYTTFSYIVIFFLMLGSLRRREQVDRLCSTVILTSLPISLYGILQHYHLDSLPWSGDVVMRVAANMGNAIFVAAYLIMAVPITLGRLVESFSALLKEEEGSISHAILAGCYTFVLSVQLICIFFTQSRGPQLGLLGGMFVFMLIALISLRRNLSDQSRLNANDVLRALGFALLSIPVGIVPAYVVLIAMKRGWRWLWLAWVAQTLLVLVFLVLFNIPNTPLSSLRDLPYLGRLGQILNTEAGTGKVRVLIWEGAIELIKSNPVRALVGYGPETMHVVYNPYYPPDLAHYEARNASPDRSHNETFDALVITGVNGFVIYMLLFASIFYYGLKWLGFMESKRQRNLFLALSISGGVLGVFIPRLAEGTYKLSGVGLPVGFIAGTCLYLMIAAALFYTRRQPTALSRQILLIALFSAIVAHFIEIHFGIAIASTRTYFWVYTALFVLLGLNRIQEAAHGAEPAAAPSPAGRSAAASSTQASAPEWQSRRARRRVRREEHKTTASPDREAGQPRFSLSARLLVGSLIVAVILFTMGFEFVANPMGEIDSLRIISLSLTTRAPRGDLNPSYGVLWMFFLTWLVGALVVLGETERTSPTRQTPGWWLSALGTYAGVTLGVFIVGMGIHTSLIKPGVDIANTISFYYAAIAVLGVALALSLLRDARLPERLCQFAYTWAYALAIAVVVAAILVTNVSIVKADIYYKQGLKLEEAQRWDTAIQYYDKAISLARDQDYYYLFLGRAMMGKASTATDSADRIHWFEESSKALNSALQLNPLNTDHYANLGRLNRNWADYATTAEERAQKLEQAHNYYVQAAKYSPHNAQIFNEWAMVYMAKGDYEGALEKLTYSLGLDKQFGSTYLILGNVYAMQNKLEDAANAYRQALALEPENAEAFSALGYIYYQQDNITDALSSNLEAIRLDPGLARAHSTLGLIYFKLGRLQEAVDENLKVLQAFPDDFISHRNLALLYQQLGQIDDSLTHAQRALQLAPESDRAALQTFIEQLKAQKQATQPSQ